MNLQVIHDQDDLTGRIVWPLSKARERAAELARSVDNGIDVLVEKRKQDAAAQSKLTLSELAAIYFALAEKKLAPHTFKQRWRLWEKYLAPRHAQLPAEAIKPSMIGSNIREVATFGKTLPRHVLITWTQLFHVAVGQGVVETNPCRDLELESIIGSEPPPRQRVVLKGEGLVSFLRALSDLPRPSELAIRLLILTGVRVSQLSEARVDEFNLDAGVWSIPAERRKNRRFTIGPHDVLLPSEAVAWVRELVPLADRDGFLFPWHPECL